jgi:hypothetical protein
MASISWSVGRTDFFVADQGTTIWHAFQNPGTSFYGWEPIGDIPNVRKLVVTSAGPGNLDVFGMYLTAADTDATPRHIKQIKYRNGFQPPVDVPLQNAGNQVVNDFSAASWGFGSTAGLPRIDLVIMDHGNIEHYWANRGDDWQGFELLGYVPHGSIAMSSFGPGNLDIAVLSDRDANHNTYMHYGAWSGFTQQMQPLPTPAPPQHSDVVDQLVMGYAVAAARGGRTDIVVGLELSDLSFAPWQAWYTSDTVLHGGQFF